MSSIKTYDLVSLPISVMFLFVQLEVCHKKECDVSKCPLLLVAPKCNFRCVAPCRIEEMPNTREFYHDGTAKVLLCKTMVGSEQAIVGSEQAINGYSLIDFVTPYERCTFSFDNLRPAIAETKKLINAILKQKEENMKKKGEQITSISKSFEGVEDALENIDRDVPTAVGRHTTPVTGTSNEAVNLSEYLLSLSNYFNQFRDEKNYEELYNILVKNYENSLQGMMEKQCIKSSNYMIKTVLAFQHLTTLRLTYIEGNHRHVKFFSLLSGIQILKSNKDRLLLIRSTAPIPANDLSDCNLAYAIKIATNVSSNTEVMQEAIQQSLLQNDQLAKAITQEQCHR